MARVIDAEKVLGHFKLWIESGQVEGSERKAVETCISVIESEPTLTPPNEPLTLEELREMCGYPVFVISKDKGKFWALVNMNSVYVDTRKCFFLMMNTLNTAKTG